jgi:hypothetical protein
MLYIRNIEALQRAGGGYMHVIYGCEEEEDTCMSYIDI